MKDGSGDFVSFGISHGMFLNVIITYNNYRRVTGLVRLFKMIKVHIKCKQCLDKYNKTAI